jgi:zinc protease
MSGLDSHVDGIPVLRASTAGAMRAGLMFRVGNADESLTTNGVTHLVEHLALHRHGATDYHYNGATGATTTQFLIQGSPDDVVTFLNGVCASLRDLPLDRLATETKILETEASSRPAAVNQQMPLWRHGARNFGLVSYPEWGMRTLQAADVHAWARTWFTRDNAVLWIAGGQLPAGLRLDLPQGQRQELPQESSALPVTPAYFNSSSPFIVMDARAPRTQPATMYTRALERALFRDLRQDKGLSYLATASYETSGGPLATITAVADALPEKRHDAVAAFVTVLRRLGEQLIDPVEIEAIRSMELEALREPETEARLLVRRATDLLTGFPSSSTEELIHNFEHLTAEDVREVGTAINASALLMVPHGHSLEGSGFEAAPTLSRYAVTGTRHKSRASHQIVVTRGLDGVSLTGPDGSATVLFEQCVAMLRWPDGARQLFGPDGINVHIEPTLISIPRAALAELDQAVPHSVIVDMPHREPDNIPKSSIISNLRIRLRASTLPLRARLERTAVNRGGVPAMLIAVATAPVGVAAAILAISTQQPQLGWITALCGAVLLWRRVTLDHW